MPALWAATPPPAVVGLYLQVLSTACVAVMALVAKLAGRQGLPVFEIVLARSLVLLVMSAAMLARSGAQAQWPWCSERRLLFVARGVCGFGAVSCLYAAVQFLPLGDVAVLAFLTPVLVAVAAPLILGERASRVVLLVAVPLCGLGVVLVAQPRMLFGAGAGTLSAVGVTIGVMQAVFSAAAKLCIRSLGSSEPVASIIFAMAAVSCIGSAALCALLPAHFVAPAGAQWGLLLAAGALGCGVQLLATTALKLSKATPVVMMSHLTVVWGMLLDLALGDRPSLLGLLGAALVCSASLVVVLAERRGGPGGDQPRPAVKAKGSDAHEWQRLAGEEEDGAGSQPPAQGGRQLELAEAGSARIGAVRWGSAADVGQGFDAQIKAAPLLPESLKE